MNRKIKFRAWEKNLKEIIPIHSINFEAKMVNVDSAWRLFDEVELMQYTGLKDKNGKEIYEGDIVKVLIQGGYSQHFMDIEHLKKVEYNANRACWTPFERCHLWRDEHGTFKAIEVIGNIYENPHLLSEREGGKYGSS